MDKLYTEISYSYRSALRCCNRVPNTVIIDKLRLTLLITEHNSTVISAKDPTLEYDASCLDVDNLADIPIKLNNCQIIIAPVKFVHFCFIPDLQFGV